MSFTKKDQNELNQMAAQEWQHKYREYFSIFKTQGEDGLFARLAAFYAQENWASAELDALAAKSLSEAEVMREIRMNPDVQLPDYDKAYIRLFMKLSSQALLKLEERGALEDLLLLESLPPLAETQYMALRAEAEGTKKVAAASSASSDDEWLKAYRSSPTDWLRKPIAGHVRMKFPDGERKIPVAEFQKQFDKAVAAGKI